MPYPPFYEKDFICVHWTSLFFVEATFSRGQADRFSGQADLTLVTLTKLKKWSLPDHFFSFLYIFVATNNFSKTLLTIVIKMINVI
jgi:hypothetical protein